MGRAFLTKSAQVSRVWFSHNSLKPKFNETENAVFVLLVNLKHLDHNKDLFSLYKDLLKNIVNNIKYHFIPHVLDPSPSRSSVEDLTNLHFLTVFHSQL